MTPLENPKQFLLAGKATANFLSAKTGSKLTFSINRSKDDKVYFVNRRKASGAGFLGIIGSSDEIFHKGRECTDHLMAGVFGWIWNNLDHEDLIITHIGRCGACRRELTDEVSIARGIGPVCAKRLEPH